MSVRGSRIGNNSSNEQPNPFSLLMVGQDGPTDCDGVGDVGVRWLEHWYADLLRAETGFGGK